MVAPAQPKLYHLCHVDRLPSIVADGCLWCDAEVARRSSSGTTVGMDSIKRRRREELRLRSHPELFVGQCVLFYFCPRSVMLYLIHQANHPELNYRGGQSLIVHLQADLYESVAWAEANGRRWAFTLSNAGALYFEDRASLEQLGEINWGAVNATQWGGSGVDPAVKEGKQAEFLMEMSFPWELVERIGVRSHTVLDRVMEVLPDGAHRPSVEVLPAWYY